MQMRCEKCKKELGNKDIVELWTHDKVEWSSDKEMLETSYGGERFYYHKKCFEELKKAKEDGKKN